MIPAQKNSTDKLTIFEGFVEAIAGAATDQKIKYEIMKTDNTGNWLPSELTSGKQIYFSQAEACTQTQFSLVLRNAYNRNASGNRTTEYWTNPINFDADPVDGVDDKWPRRQTVTHGQVILNASPKVPVYFESDTTDSTKTVLVIDPSKVELLGSNLAIDFYYELQIDETFDFSKITDSMIQDKG